MRVRGDRLVEFHDTHSQGVAADQEATIERPLNPQVAGTREGLPRTREAFRGLRALMSEHLPGADADTRTTIDGKTLVTTHTVGAARLALVNNGRRAAIQMRGVGEAVAGGVPAVLNDEGTQVARVRAPLTKERTERSPAAALNRTGWPQTTTATQQSAHRSNSHRSD